MDALELLWNLYCCGTKEPHRPKHKNAAQRAASETRFTNQHLPKLEKAAQNAACKKSKNETRFTNQHLPKLTKAAQSAAGKKSKSLKSSIKFGGLPENKQNKFQKWNRIHISTLWSPSSKTNTYIIQNENNFQGAPKRNNTTCFKQNKTISDPKSHQASWTNMLVGKNNVSTHFLVWYSKHRYRNVCFHFFQLIHFYTVYFPKKWKYTFLYVYILIFLGIYRIEMYISIFSTYTFLYILHTSCIHMTFQTQQVREPCNFLWSFKQPRSNEVSYRAFLTLLFTHQPLRPVFHGPQSPPLRPPLQWSHCTHRHLFGQYDPAATSSARAQHCFHHAHNHCHR